MPGASLVNPRTGEPVSGNTKLSSFRAAHEAEGLNGQSRERRIRQDASVGAAERAAERVLGLPEGSVRARNPDGRDTRSDKRVAKHRQAHDA